ncbi:MAG: pyruvate:ferredoxin (flavodoxin) oxidoreductase [Acholeplasmataceae bacterium]|nr:pyruvate:ferredoxin (flavodoxin) oxidoreductase [Acholeplasmataceae bacterium]
MAKKFQSMDGNQAAAWASYAFTEVAGIYPITPSSPMAEYTDDWSSKGQKNLFGMPVRVVEMQSEAGAAGTVHGSLQAGALTTTYTASQGLLLKIPNMYKIAGELLPGVIHVSARSLATQALSIFGDHQDVMACRQTGFAMLATSSVQEVMDLAGVAHLAAIKSSVPFMHFFDGFRTSHEIQKVEVMDYEVFDRLLDREAVAKFRSRALNPNNPVEKGSAQNDDVYFQAREAQNKYYDAVPDIVNEYMQEISKVTGRDYAPFNYYGDPEATDVIVSIGSVNECIKEVIDYKMKQGEKVGAVNVHLYRPFSKKYFMAAMPKTVKRVAVLDRTKEQGSIGEPLYLDVKSVFYGEKSAPMIIGGRYGLSSKDTTPAQIFAVYKNLAKGKKALDNFTVGINDDVTHLSLPLEKEINVAGDKASQLIFFGLGSDGTVGANKSTIKIIGDNTDNYAQAYFAYDSKKSGGVTRSHLRFSPEPIRSTYLVTQADFVACSLDTYVEKYDMLSSLKENGTFLLNTTKPVDELIEFMPNSFKAELAKKHAKFYIIDATTLARQIGLGNRTNTIMQSAFFKLNEQIMPYEKAQELMKYYAKKTYSKKGEAVVELNYKAIDTGAQGLVEVAVDPAWATLKPEKVKVDKTLPEFVQKIANPINAIKGYDLPVSAFMGYEDGTMISGTTAYEKREISTFVPVWNPNNCIQCNQCSFVCPHAVIRPFLVTPEEEKKAPKTAKYLNAVGKGLEGLKYTIQISAADCTGCEVCVNTCPGKKDKDGNVNKAISMVNVDELHHNKTYHDSEYFFNNVSYKTDLVDITANAKNSQFAQPLFEFSGACGGCGETPYVKLITQLFGDRMVVANATGCSSIYGGSYPASPYTKNKEGMGPAWANSLFEDNAEFGYGMRMATEALRNRLAVYMEEVANCEEADPQVKALCQEWLENRKDGNVTKRIAKELVPLLEGKDCETAKHILELKDYIMKRSQWIFGGDGWAYDIGYGGLDHVIANQEDVNILVIDTEVYSNTGGQSSKSSPTASIAKFTAGGKTGKKKDLAAIAMSYGHVYVATIAHGASQAQMLKAIKEAESYDGPSIIIAYAPCINHGLKRGMSKSQEQAKLAVECGYWVTFRYDPRRIEQGLNPFQLDSKEPQWEKYEDHLMTETRYAQLKAVNPEHAAHLLEVNMEEAQRRYAMYQRYLAMDYSKK